MYIVIVYEHSRTVPEYVAADYFSKIFLLRVYRFFFIRRTSEPFVGYYYLGHEIQTRKRTNRPIVGIGGVYARHRRNSGGYRRIRYNIDYRYDVMVRHKRRSVGFFHATRNVDFVLRVRKINAFTGGGNR